MPPNRPGSVEAAGRGRTAWLIFAGLVFLYTASYVGTFRSDDEHILAARAQSFALWGDLGQTQVYGNQRVQALLAQGPAATEIEPAQAAVGALAYKFAAWLGAGGAQMFLLIAAFATAATGAIVFLTCRTLGFAPAVSVTVALLYGIGTMAWPYATTGFRDPLAALFWSIAFLGWSEVLGGQERRWPGWLLLAIGIAGAVLSKNTSFAALVAFLIVGLLLIWRKPDTPRDSRKVGWTLTALLLLLLAGGGLASGSGLMARYSPAYFTFLAGHALRSPWTQVAAATLGPFLSPSRSIFLFSPPLLLGVAGLAVWRRRQSWFALTAVLSVMLLALVQALFYRQGWAGTFGWGLRFMLPALPLVAVLSAPIVEKALSGTKALALAAVVLLVGVGIIIQASAVLVPWVKPYLAWQAVGLDPFQPQAAWDATFLAIPAQLGYLCQPNTWSLAGLRSGSALPLALHAAALLGFLLVVIVVSLRRSPRPMGASRVAGTTLFALVIPIALVASLKVGDTFWGGDHPEYEDMRRWLDGQLEVGDIVLLENYASPLWGYAINRWDANVRWYSLPFDIPGGGDDIGLSTEASWIVPLVEADAARGRAWLITSTEAPNYAGSVPRAYLEAVRGKGDVQAFPGLGQTEAILYR